MASPQFNKKVSTTRWYSLTYQSNATLTADLHNQVKPVIAKLLVDAFTIGEIHSYIHGSIVFSINTTTPFSKFDEIVTVLAIPLAGRSPRLHFELTLVAKNQNNVHYMYIDGIDSMDTNFQNSIVGFWPKNSK